MLPFFAFALLLLPSLVSASVSITEIMYDAEGADTKHEWIEVFNDGASVDLSEWKLFEGASNHGLEVFSGSANVGNGQYAIIADDPATFLADFPSFSGTVFNTSFSGGLNNTTGETLILRDGTLTDKDTVTYNPALGANGDGKTLHRVGSSWQALSPTPGGASGGGAQSSPPPETEDEEEETVSPQTVQTTQSSQGSPVVPQIKASAGEDRTVIAGAASVYTGIATGLKGDILPNARFVWSFGNGDSKEGKSILYAYLFPGKYVVTLDASSSEWSASDRIVVTVLPAELSITSVTPEYMEVENRSSHELDLGLWQLKDEGALFIFPAHTIILPKSSVRISASATGLAPFAHDVAILYPNGTFAASYRTPLLTYVQSVGASSRTSQKAALPPILMIPEGTEESEEGDEAVVVPEALTASAALIESPKPFSMPYFVWFGGLVIIVLGGLGATYFVRRKFTQS